MKPPESVGKKNETDGTRQSSVFFSRENFRFARYIFRKSAREFKKVPVKKTPEFCPWKLTIARDKLLKKCPWKMKSARDKFWNFARDKTKSARDKPVVF